MGRTWWAGIGIIGLAALAAWGILEAQHRAGMRAEARQVDAARYKQARAGAPMMVTQKRLNDTATVYLLHVRPSANYAFLDRYCLIYGAATVSSMQCWDAAFTGPADAGWPDLEQ